MNTSLTAHNALLGGVSSQLASVARQQEGIAAAAEGGLAALQDLHHRAGGLDTKLQHSLQLQARTDTSCPAGHVLAYWRIGVGLMPLSCSHSHVCTALLC